MRGRGILSASCREKALIDFDQTIVEMKRIESKGDGFTEPMPLLDGHLKLTEDRFAYFRWLQIEIGLKGEDQFRQLKMNGECIELRD